LFNNLAFINTLNIYQSSDNSSVIPALNKKRHLE